MKLVEETQQTILTQRPGIYAEHTAANEHPTKLTKPNPFQSTSKLTSYKGDCAVNSGEITDYEGPTASNIPICKPLTQKGLFFIIAKQFTENTPGEGGRCLSYFQESPRGR